MVFDINPQRIIKEINIAETNIRKLVRTTTVEYSDYLSSQDKLKVYLKLENTQHTGSFKFRGALNKLLSLSQEQLNNGIITASTGNHGMAVAHALRIIGSNGTVYLPENVSRSKLNKLKQFNIHLEFYGQDSEETEQYAKDQAVKKNQLYISPYNDLKIIAGQGTIGIELEKQLNQIDHVFICVGGGGLVSGIASYLKSINPNIKIYGCLPQNSPVMYESIKAGQIIKMDTKDTLSDGSAGGIEQGTITFNLCQLLVDDYILVTEDEIKQAIKIIYEKQNQTIEGAAGVAVSSFLKIQENIQGNAVIVICGGNIDTNKIREIVG